VFHSLRTFIDELDRRGELVRVDVPVASRLEIAEIHRRVIAADGPALLFRSVDGGDTPVVTNLFGTLDRARLAFGGRPHRIIEDLVEIATRSMPPKPRDLWQRRQTLGSLLRLGTRDGRRGPVMDVVEPPRLTQLPALTSWPEDGGPFLTLPLVYTEHPDGHGHNLGMYRIQIHDDSTTGMHWQIGKGGGFHHALAEARGTALPATVFLGGPPALILAAIAPLPENVPELLLASLISGAKLGRWTGVNGLPVPVESEFALMGSVPPTVRRPEGPFGDHYGYYSLEHDYPVLQVEAVAHRRDAILPATVVGKPRQEDFYIGDLLTELLSPIFPVVMPAVERLWSYGETGFHSLSAAVVKPQRYRREAMASAFRILGEGQLSLTKFLLVTDRPVDLSDFTATLEHVLERMDPRTDLYVFSNLSMDTLDYTGPEVNLGSKGVLLGVGDPIRTLPREFSAAEVPQGVGAIRPFCGGCLVVDGPAWEDDPELGSRLAGHPSMADWPLVVLCDDADVCTRSPIRFLWTTFTRFEPAADIHARHSVHRHHLVYEGPVVIDARMKPGYPDELLCDPETAALVDRRWKEYFPDRDVEMGDSDRGHLD
jgi:UbiD family decarboxylase